MMKIKAAIEFDKGNVSFWPCSECHCGFEEDPATQESLATWRCGMGLTIFLFDLTWMSMDNISVYHSFSIHSK